ncbi:hypothetical protein ElyMa_004180200 [Elysia marginata]|uniref:Uncharacterized protein n=1 Tax=Elysia marginata TaxID=1093978 RepID=A0AAV4GJG8_9GAST|nr:hypothetical protein ElyMa_004180200 [Elysia marginata]
MNVALGFSLKMCVCAFDDTLRKAFTRVGWGNGVARAWGSSPPSVRRMPCSPPPSLAPPLLVSTAMRGLPVAECSVFTVHTEKALRRKFHTALGYPSLLLAKSFSPPRGLSVSFFSLYRPSDQVPQFTLQISEARSKLRT